MSREELVTYRKKLVTYVNTSTRALFLMLLLAGCGTEGASGIEEASCPEGAFRVRITESVAVEGLGSLPVGAEVCLAIGKPRESVTGKSKNFDCTIDEEAVINGCNSEREFYERVTE